MADAQSALTMSLTRTTDRPWAGTRTRVVTGSPLSGTAVICPVTSVEDALAIWTTCSAMAFGSPVADPAAQYQVDPSAPAVCAVGMNESRRTDESAVPSEET